MFKNEQNLKNQKTRSQERWELMKIYVFPILTTSWPERLPFFAFYFYFFIGGGINEDNLERILTLGVKEFHCSARIHQDSEMMYQRSGISLGGSLTPPQYGRKVASVMKVRNMLNRAAMYWDASSS